MATIYDKSGAGWDDMDIDDYFTSYFKTKGDVVQQEKNLQHHINWKRITSLWWQWGILKLFAPKQTKGNLLFNVWLMCMKRAIPPFEQGIQNCSKKILTSLRQVKTCWCACPLTSLMDQWIKIWLVLTKDGWPSWWGIWRKLNQATSNRSDL